LFEWPLGGSVNPFATLPRTTGGRHAQRRSPQTMTAARRLAGNASEPVAANAASGSSVGLIVFGLCRIEGEQGDRIALPLAQRLHDERVAVWPSQPVP
jgi:hypothetical protein